MASFGMMNQAYFVGKNTLLDWINNFLEINIEKVEQCANGAIYCNLWDALHPGTIPMSRVDFTVKHEYEYTKNWKLLQNAFQKAGITKPIPVQRLIKARYQDNLEFLQWMFKYARDTYNGDPDEPTYDALGRRSKSKGGQSYTGSSSSRNNSRSSAFRARGKENNNQRNRRGQTTNNVRCTPRSQSSSHGIKQQQNNNNAELEALRNETKQLSEQRNVFQSKLNALQTEHEELSNVAKDIEQERDFYFNKVVVIEQILKKQDDQNTPLLKAIYEVLYQTDEAAQSQSQKSNQEVDKQLNYDLSNMQMQ